MFTPFERMVAFRYLRSQRREGFVSVIAGFSLLGIALGVATLIIVMAVMNGFRQDILTRILGVNGHLDVEAISNTLGDYDLLALRLAEVDGVISVTPVIQGQVMASAGVRSSGAIVRGMRGADLAARNIIAENLILGEIEGYAAGNGVIVGSRLASRFGIDLGDEITLISPQGTVSAFGTMPRVKAFKIVAIFNVGMSDFDSSVIFMPLELAQTYFMYPKAVSSLEIFIDNPDEASQVAANISEITGPEIRVQTWQQTNAPFFNALQVERNVMFLILALIILVAAFNIVAGLIMLVKDKGRDIAILRTMGATQGMVMRVFFIAGASVGVTGTLLGLVLGVLFCENIEVIRQFLEGMTGVDLFAAEVYFLSQIPAEMDWRETLSVVSMSLVLSFVATLYPSWRAARLDPVEALRYE